MSPSPSSPPQREGLLSPFRALDLAGELGFLCGKILGDLGADVIKIEPPGGDPGRNRGPFYQDQPHPEKSLYWFAYNNNKRGITLDLESATGRELFLRLIKDTDFVIESFAPGYLDGLGLGYTALRKVKPALVMVSISPYGQTGPYSDYRASDLELMAMGGAMSVTGDPDRAPVRVSFPQAPMWAGMHAAMGALIAHYHRAITGEGQYVDVSAQASILWAIAHAPSFWSVNQTIPAREGGYVTGRSITGAKMRVIFPCRDGYLNFIVYGGPAGRHTNRELVKWMDEHGMATEWLKQKNWDDFDIATVTQEEIDLIEEPAAAFFQTINKAQFFQRVLAREMLGYPLATAEDALADPQLQERGFWQEVEHPELGRSIPYPGPFAQLSECGCGIWRRAPLIGEQNEEIYVGELGLSKEELVMLKEAGVV
ncbi:MAG: CoA transferase [Dehalococcoidia bacterium]|nr:CoA transferase [Dehalococcoidia bacterium]